MRVRLFCLFGLYVFAQYALANEDYHAIAKEALANKENQASIYHQEAIQVKDKHLLEKNQYQGSAGMALKRASETMKNIYGHVSNKKKPGIVSKIIIFVSLSMPRDSLVAYLQDAKKVNAAVVVRGLKNNSFKETLNDMLSLTKQADGYGFEINPVLFEKFAIQTVPTILAISPTTHCLEKGRCQLTQDADAVLGNITLSAALRMIRDKGEVANMLAANALSRLEERGHV